MLRQIRPVLLTYWSLSRETWLTCTGTPTVSSFNFIHHPPKFRSIMYDSWDLVALRASVLTVPNHHFEEPAPNPTITQLLSMFASNPAHRKVWFSRRTVPDDRDGGSAFSLRVPLHHLKELDFFGGLSSESFTTWTMQGTQISLLAHAKVLSGTSHGPLHRTSETAFTIVTVLKVRWDFPFPGGIVSPHFACMIEAKFSLNQYT